MRKGVKVFSICFLAPAFLVYLVLFIFPTILSVYYSLFDWDAVGQKIFIGLENYTTMFSDPDYWKVVKNTFTLVGYSLLFQVPPGLILAYMLINTKKGFKFFRSVYFLPVIIAPIAIGLMFFLFYNSEFGLINKVLENLGLAFLKRDWLSDSKVVLRSVVLPEVWQYIGMHFVIFLAALQSIPKEVLESAEIDGTGPFRKFWSIVFPMVWDVVQICVVLTVTGSLKSFDHCWILTKGGPGLESTYLGLYMFKNAFISNKFGYGSSVTVSILAYSLLFTVLFKRFTNKDSVYN